MNPASVVKTLFTICFIIATVLIPIALPAQTSTTPDMKDCPYMGTGHDMPNCPMKPTAASNKQGKNDVHSKYAGMETRKIKSLTEDQISGYLNGEGMGLAMPAELNHYPGPKHVQAVAAKLKLTADQEAALQSAYDRMHESAVDLGKQIVDKETELDGLFADGSITEERLATLTSEIAALQGKVRAAHLAAHLATKSVLTSAQVKQYDQLRGYGKTVKQTGTKKM